MPGAQVSQNTAHTVREDRKKKRKGKKANKKATRCSFFYDLIYK